MRVNVGFSLLELIVVMAIIGILIAISIPSYHTYTRRAHFTEIVEATSPYRIGIEECFQITGRLSECTPGKNGVPNNLSGTRLKQETLVKSISVTNNASIRVTPNKRYGITEKDTYILTPTIHEQALNWHSSGGGVMAGYAN